MDSLRFALLIVGVVIVALVYWQARRKPSADIKNTSASSRIEPGFDDDDTAYSDDLEPQADLPLIGGYDDDDDDDERSAAERMTATRGVDADTAASESHASGEAKDEAQKPEVPEKVISLRIVKKDGSDFATEEVILNLRGVGLVHGRFGIFHRQFDETNDDAIFSVASLTEPGNFDLQNIRDKRLAGLSFFMLRPGPGRGVEAFDKMVETARAVATSLQGELLDGDGSTMSIQRERFMREELIQYELKHLKL